MPGSRVGVWILGIRGGLASTVLLGARAIARGRAGTTGLLTEVDPFRALDLVRLDALVFGGHDIRKGSIVDAVRESWEQSRAFDPRLAGDLREDLEAIDGNVREGTSVGSGQAVQRLLSGELTLDREPPATICRRLATDLEEFASREKLDRVVVVNLASTEAAGPAARWHRSGAHLERILDGKDEGALPASTLYAAAAARAGCAYVNFTPSRGALCPAARRLFDERDLPWAGEDGKTGETLVKSALAPMFLWRNLEVLSWYGYNLLGDRDGLVLDDEKHKATKVGSKDAVLRQILGYSPRSRVGIDFVPSLGDRKTAWDFVHFEGFLGHRMSLEFTWHGCDAILGAPLVLDLVRFVEHALRHGHGGAQPHLGFYFKRPLPGGPADLPGQFRQLLAYAEGQLAERKAPHAAPPGTALPAKVKRGRRPEAPGGGAHPAASPPAPPKP